MHCQQRSTHRQRENQQRLARRTGHAVGQWHEDDHADLEEHRNTDHEACNGQRQRRAPVAETVDQRLGQCFGPARQLDDAPDHRAQGDDDRDVAEGLAHAAFNGGHQIGRLNTRDQRHDDADQHQRNERLKFVLEHQEQQQCDARTGHDHQHERRHARALRSMAVKTDNETAG
ncbi:hypothetical protein ALP64_203046 [Pseudomonas syringae pv. actinidiae]|nr:hypothetical protein ALP64_203046 [Pseudomonas syringae pv. actinidiae]